MAAENSDGMPISPSEKSLTGSLASDENEKSVSRSPSSYSIREDKWPDLVVSRPRKLDAWWLPRRKYIVRQVHVPTMRRAFQKCPLSKIKSARTNDQMFCEYTTCARLSLSLFLYRHSLLIISGYLSYSERYSIGYIYNTLYRICHPTCKKSNNS